MTYTKGVLENAIQAIYDRLASHMNVSGKLKDIKSIVIGARPRATGDIALPRIIIASKFRFNGAFVNTANSASQKDAALDIEFRIECEKLKETGVASCSVNNLFDGAGNGPIAVLQWFNDSLVYTADGVWKPALDLQLSSLPQINNDSEGTGNSIEFVINYTFKIRYTNGVMGGTLS